MTGRETAAPILGLLGERALDLAARGWAVLPLAGKVPIIAGGRGVYDATTDRGIVAGWWRTWPTANIGVRVPEPLVVIDVDPRHGGHLRLAELETAHCPLPETLTVWTGRRDGGRHLYFRRPSGKLAGKLAPGIDVKTSTGHVVAPPSLHPDTGKSYRWELHTVAAPPLWLVRLLRPAAPIVKTPARPDKSSSGRRVADAYSATTSWAEVLEPHGWRCLDSNGDADGARWRHPNATSQVSATIRHECLFVYSPNTPLIVTESGNPYGYTRFRAYAVLTHHGDLSAAARALWGAS